MLLLLLQRPLKLDCARLLLTSERTWAILRLVLNAHLALWLCLCLCQPLLLLLSGLQDLLLGELLLALLTRLVLICTTNAISHLVNS